MQEQSKDFERLALPHLDAVLRAATALSGRAADAQDLAQTTFLKALENFEDFKPGTSCKAWLMRILRNTWIDRLRHEKALRIGPLPEETTLSAAAPDEPPPAEAALDERKILERFSDADVLAALATLGDDQRLALLLVDVEQMDHAEVAEVLAVAVGTVKSRTSRARAALRDKLLAHAKELGFLGR